MSVSTPAKTAMDILTACSYNSREGALLDVLSAALEDDFVDVGDPEEQLEHFIRVAAKLAGAASILVRVLAGLSEQTIHQVLQHVAGSDLMREEGGPQPNG